MTRDSKTIVVSSVGLIVPAGYQNRSMRRLIAKKYRGLKDGKNRKKS